MANPTTNYGWPMPTSTDLVTDLPADFAAFGQPVDTSLKALNPETTLGDIAYRSATSNTNTRLGIGSTGQVLTVNSGVPSWATPTAGMTNPMTTTGDTIYSSSGSTPARLGIGSTGNVLTVSGGVPTWAAPAAGGMTLIASGTLSGASVSLASIPSTYVDLKLYINNPYIAAAGPVSLGLTFNATTSAVYSRWGGNTNNTTTFSNQSQTSFTLGDNVDFPLYSTQYYSATAITIPYYAGTNNQKGIQWSMQDYTGSFPGMSGSGGTNNTFNTTAISSLEIKAASSTFSGGTYALYGVK